MSVISEELRGSGIQVIARAAEMLRLLQAHPGGLNQAEIGERLGMRHHRAEGGCKARQRAQKERQWPKD